MNPSVSQNDFLILAAKRPYVLLRLALVLSKRGFEIVTFISEPSSENPEMQRLKITVRGPEAGLTQIKKNILKLVDVVHLIDVNDAPKTFDKETGVATWQV